METFAGTKVQDELESDLYNGNNPVERAKRDSNRLHGTLTETLADLSAPH